MRGQSRRTASIDNGTTLEFSFAQSGESGGYRQPMPVTAGEVPLQANVTVTFELTP